MRHYILSLGILLVSFFTSNAQSETTTDKLRPNHEIKLNLAYTLFETIELNYELILDNDFSVGLAANYWFDDAFYIDYQIIPYFRFYPIERKRGSGFFIEANGSFMSITTDEYYDGFYGSPVEGETSFAGGMGVASGYKFISRSNFVAELYLGAGRVFGHDIAEVYPRLGITMGKRF